jgi:hypothetical protein
MNSFLAIEHAVTADMDDGQPLPPLIVDGVVWRVVRRWPGNRTQWRRLWLAEQISASDDSVEDAS